MSITSILLLCIIGLLAGYCAKLKLRQRSQDDTMPRGKEVIPHISNNDIMQYLRETADSFRPLMENKRIDFMVKCEPESMMGWIDTDKTDKVILLLLSDIAKHTAPEGKVALEACTNDSYDQVTIRISDNGDKMSGMGLILAHSLTRLLHGTVESEYYEGQGNKVIIVLPIKKDVLLPEQTGGEQPAVFHIPSNIELNVPTIELPIGYEGERDEKQLEALVHQTYVSADQEYLRRATQCVTDHITDSDYDRETFAADMGSSVSTLYNKIRALTGKNVTNFVRDIRISTACRLARETPDLRVSDLAYSVGFKDPKYFATSFKRVMGIQPKEYLSQIRSEK